MDIYIYIYIHTHIGSVAYDEFCEELQSFESDDIHTMIMFIKHYTKELVD